MKPRSLLRVSVSSSKDQTNKMSTKTNKSFTKRLKVSKNGKIKARATGRNHFRAKESRRAQLASNRDVTFNMSNKEIAHYIKN